MKLQVSYNNELKKTFIKVGEDDKKELTFEDLLSIAESDIDKGEEFELSFEGFDENPDVELNYKKVFEDILNLKDDTEILDLKKEIEDNEKKEDESAIN